MPLLFPLKFWQPRSHSKALYPLYPVHQQTLTLLSPKYTPNFNVQRLLPCFLSFSSKICFPHHCEKNLLETRMISLSSIRWVTSHFFRVNFKFLTMAYMVLFICGIYLLLLTISWEGHFKKGHVTQTKEAENVLWNSWLFSKQFMPVYLLLYFHNLLILIN